ncbi:translation initiation factor eIF-2B subunit gamma isoform X3 [Triticum aestivum]|uniref:translation initiation factor eIF-2B subunit gamma isoform X3 n=1 Tax=Triticum aestivum TaxID=4565 RepID=UPI001D014321|nr:translation initiation factor eIF-2B subunit gamma-like isoform X3 [Triticum aestivum]
MDFQVVVLAGGTSEKLSPLVSKDVPKALLPVANRPAISYVLDLLESSDLKDIIVVVEGQEAARLVGAWISSAYLDRLVVEVVAVTEDIGTAGALRAISKRLVANDVLVISGDLVTDVLPGAVAATHRRNGAAVTALLCSVPVSGPSDAASSGGKDKAKKPCRLNIVGLDITRQFLLHVVSGTDVEKDVRVYKRKIRAVGQMEIRSDLMDAHLYAFNRFFYFLLNVSYPISLQAVLAQQSFDTVDHRTTLQDVLEQKETYRSIRLEVLPYLVKSQLRSAPSGGEGTIVDETGNVVVPPSSNLQCLSQHRAIAPSAFKQDLLPSSGGGTHRCCVYIASKNKYCHRLNSIQAYCDINRDVIGEASHLSGYSFSSHNNIIHPSCVLGSKTTVGPQCMLAEGSQLGDKCGVKRSVIGRHCRIGSNVKIVNSVVMNHVVIEDGCHIQGSVVCNNVQLQERAVLKDCQVGAGYTVTTGSDHKSESLARK